MQNPNNDYTYWFIFMSLFNTSLGLNNLGKNETQDAKQQEILDKLNRILEKLND